MPETAQTGNNVDSIARKLRDLEEGQEALLFYNPRLRQDIVDAFKKTGKVRRSAIRVLKHVDGQTSTREIARRSNMKEPNVSAELMFLKKYKIVIKDGGGGYYRLTKIAKSIGLIEALDEAYPARGQDDV
jgi:predicted transcriptional regulator